MSSYKIVEWSEKLDLSDFYRRSKEKGFLNNSNQELMIDCLRNEREWQAWILYHNNIAVGSVAAHSIEEGYRICVRTCVLTEQLEGSYGKALRTISVITQHQNPTSQFFIPVCMDWVANKGDMYITSHPSEVGTQKRVHKIWGPTMEKMGVVSRSFEKEYRGHVQTFWKVNPDIFLQQLNENPRW